MNIQDFIDYIITFDNVDNILENCKTQSEKGFIFERLFDIIIKFGFCPIFSNSNFNHLIGNSNNAKLKILKNIDQYLNEKVLSGNSGGCSDITLQNKNDDIYVFISSKYPKSNEDIKKQKSVDYYDIQKIVAMIDDNKYIYKNYKIYLLVPNKQKVLDKVKKANKSSKYITKHMTDTNILDKDDLNKYFLAFKNDIIKNKDKDLNAIYLTNKESLSLRFHQELITKKTSDLIEEGNKSFLWGCKCRSGKTFMSGGIILKQYYLKQKLNVLIITPAPTETSPQFTDDLFNKFKDFDVFKIHHIEGSKSLNNIELVDNNIFIMSKQLLQKYINDNTIIMIKNLKLDIIIFDENHFSGTTDLSKDILSSYSSKNTIKIYLTATYNKPLKEWNIIPECQMYWDIEDEQICKKIYRTNEVKNKNENITKLKEKHGDEYIEKTIKYYVDKGLSINDIFNCYEKMPDLHLITNMFDSQRYEIIKERLNKENKMGFCFDTLFGLNTKKTKFCYENEVKTILRYISGSYKEVDGDKTIYTRINNICSEKETRLPFTQIWFLPSDNINEISRCLEKLMLEDNILKKYDILCINRKNKELVKDIKDEINKRELIAKETGKQGVILLAGNMLTLGITLNLCDLVILMNNALSSDKVLQQMYRCMTESLDFKPKPSAITEKDKYVSYMTEGENKKIGFVVDLNISRVLNTCINYTTYKNDKSIDDKLSYIIKYNLINIDVDMMKNKKIDSDTIVKKLMDIWKGDPINSFRTLLRKLDNDYEDFDNSTQKLINNTFTKSLKDDKVSLKLKLKDEDDELQDLTSGKEKLNNSDNEKSDNESLGKEKKEIQISFTKDVLPYIIPLTCILTIKNSNMDFVKMLNDIKENPELLDTFDDQCLIWWNKKDLIDLIKDIVIKYFNKNSNTYNISIQFKMSLQSLIDNPKELLELITECLKPKAIEKKENGEVFTPMTLVSEMLDKLPKEVWKNKNLKWLDPATGMGNFPIAVYLRLMEGLKDEIKDVTIRKKHILENMLYMSELNKKNVLICKQIFDINNEYKLNIYEGDSLKIDYNKVFEIKQFDIIMGNPPYQKKVGPNKTETLWDKFVIKSLKILKINGYLTFIHPSGWRNIDGKFKNIQKEIFERNLQYLEIHNEKDGLRTFSSETRYDWYIIKNENVKTTSTNIKFQDGKTNIINVIGLEFIPNGEFDKIFSLIAKNNEKKCNVIHDYSVYETRKKWMQRTKDEKYKYPCVYTVNSKSEITYYYSSEKKGHFGIPKFIWSNGRISSIGSYVDDKGEYGLTQFAYAIIDEPENLSKIKEVFDNKQFRNLMELCAVGQLTINYKVISIFKNDFWKNILTSNKDNNLLNKNNKIIEPTIIVKTKKNKSIIQDKEIKKIL